MKTLQILAVSLLILIGQTVASRGQDIVVTNEGWYLTGNLDGAVTNEVDAGDSGFRRSVVSGVPTPPYLAEAITSEIQSLADGLQGDPVKIFNYVHDRIRYEHYFGTKKGAQMTLLERSGNDFDQCALLVALLQAAGHTNAAYQFGWMLLPYDNADGSHRDLRHWLRLNYTNSNWSTTVSYLNDIFFLANYPIERATFGNNVYGFQRVWVKLPVGGTNYLLDPAFKVSERIDGIDIASASGLSSNALMTAAGGTDAGLYATNINEAALRSALTGYTTNFLSYLQENSPNASVEDIFGGYSIVASTNTALSQSLLFATTNLDGTMPIINWSALPTNLMSTLSVSFLSTNYQCYIPQLLGQRLSLTVSNTGLAQLWQDDILLAQTNSGGGSGTFNVTLSVAHPRGGWNTTNNTFIPGTIAQSATKGYQKANATYVISYAFAPHWDFLRSRQRQLDAYRQQGLADTSRQVVSESLNVMALNWQVQVELISQTLARKIGALPLMHHRVGRMAQENGYGYYMDIYLLRSAPYSADGPGDNHAQRWVDGFAFLGSAMEHGLIEQLQSTNLIAASTVKLLQLANTNGQAVYLATSNNWSTVSSRLVSYPSGLLTAVGGYVNAGGVALMPQSGNIFLAGPTGWHGYGYFLRAQNGAVQMSIGDTNGIHNGAYPSDLNAVVNPSFVNYSGYSQPFYFSSTSVFLPESWGADPVSMANGTFQLEATDLSVGQAEPRGFSFARHYNSSRRNSNLVGMSPGWLHNYYLNAGTVSAPETSLGGTTPAQMAPTMVALTSHLAVYDGTQPTAKNWLVTALIAKWAIDQITGKAVSVSLGKDTLQFVKQPDGSFTPPANCTYTLTQSNSAYRLSERHGRTFQFNSTGWGTNITDQYNQSLRIAYNASNWVTSATDWKGRTLTLGYSGTPLRLTSASDGTRSVGYNYNTNQNPRGDLVSVTDPESKTNSYLYDTNHQVLATKDALNRIVVTNIYNDQGRVTTQLSQGDLNKMWRIFWSGWQTVEQDPAGGQRTFFFDDKSRQTAVRDALGNIQRTAYDGQDHPVVTVSPMNETNRFIFDGWHNLTQTIDSLGFTNTMIYDGLDNLVTQIDARGNSNRFGYNTKFQLTGSTNGAGDWLTFAFDSTDGALTAKTDSGGSTDYQYETTYRQLVRINYPSGLGSEGFLNNALGDVLSHTNARGFVTSFQYSLRRELTNTIAPTNLTVGVGYDAAGNMQRQTDARGFTVSNLWSPAKKLISTTLPATAAGTPVVTNVYDSRDYLVSTTLPGQRTSVFTNDSAGRLIGQSDPLNRTTRFGLDANGRTIAATNAAQEATSKAFTARGELVRATDGANRITLRQFDGAGNQVVLTNRNGKRWQFQFDAANRLTSTITPRGRETKQLWNDRGLLYSIIEPSTETTTFGFDARNRVTNRTDNVGTTFYKLDANNNVTNVIESGRTNMWTFDAYDRVGSYRDADGNLIQYRYDQNGNVTNLIYPGGRNVFYAYNSHNKLTNVLDWAGRKTSLEYDLAGRLTRVARPNGTVREIGHDAANQVTNIVERLTNNFPVAFFRLNWNAAARMNWEFVAPVPHTYTPPSRAMTFDDDNRLATFNGQSVTNDTDGNMTVGPLTNSTFTSYGYNARNQLMAAGGLNYAYDPSANRTSITNGTNVTKFVINPNAALPQVLMRIRDGATNYYVHGAGLLYEVTETATSTNLLAYHYDYRGSTVALTDGNGNLTDWIEYSPYAIITYRVGTNDTPFLFSGRYGIQTDANGLLYMRARYYSPYLCRFLNADPSGFAGGLNFYAYADGNPVSSIDPFGLATHLIMYGEDTTTLFQDQANIRASQIRQSGSFDAAHDSVVVTPTYTVPAIAAALQNNQDIISVTYIGHGGNSALYPGISAGASYNLSVSGGPVNGVSASTAISALPTGNVRSDASITLLSCYSAVSATGGTSIGQAFADQYNVSVTAAGAGVGFDETGAYIRVGREVFGVLQNIFHQDGGGGWQTIQPTPIPPTFNPGGGPLMPGGLK